MSHLLLLIALLTLVDALASWVSIEIMGIAQEGNQNINNLALLVGFEGALIVRVAWGIGLSAVLALLALRFQNSRRKKLAYGGLWFISICLLLLTAYHIVVMSIGFLSVLATV